MEAAMSSVTLSVATRADVTRRAAAAFSGTPQGAHISFETPDLLWRTLTSKRWDLLAALTGAGPVSIREAARRVGRDVKAVHGDVHALLLAGVLQRDDAGRIMFPYDAVHVDFTLIKAA
jgi:predicted transcriptional regulator